MSRQSAYRGAPGGRRTPMATRNHDPDVLRNYHLVLFGIMVVLFATGDSLIDWLL